MKSIRARLGHDLFYTVTEDGGCDRFVATDVIQGDITKGTFSPVAAMGQRQLIPTPIAPKSVHGIGHLDHRKVVSEGQVAVIWSPHFSLGKVFDRSIIDVRYLAVKTEKGAFQFRVRPFSRQVLQKQEHRRLPIIEDDVIYVIKYARLFQGT